MVYCQNCGKKVKGDEDFCPSCGKKTKIVVTKIVEKPVVKEHKETKEIIHKVKILPDMNYKLFFKRIVYIILVIFLLIILYNFFLLYQSQVDKNKGFDFTIPFTNIKIPIIETHPLFDTKFYTGDKYCSDIFLGSILGGVNTGCDVVCESKGYQFTRTYKCPDKLFGMVNSKVECECQKQIGFSSKKIVL